MRKLISTSSAATLTALTLGAGVFVGIASEGVAQASCASKTGDTNVSRTGPVGIQVYKEATTCLDFNVHSASSDVPNGQGYSGWYYSGGRFIQGSRGFVYVPNDKIGYYALVTNVTTGTRLGISTYTAAANVNLAY